MTKIYGVPEEAAMDGAETMYPEFRDKIKVLNAAQVFAGLWQLAGTRCKRAVRYNWVTQEAA